LRNRRVFPSTFVDDPRRSRAWAHAARGMAGAFPDHYAVLGVERAADAAAIRSAYMAAVLTCHPDKVSPWAGEGAGGEPDGDGDGEGTTARFRAVQAAWEALRDPQTRAAYDEDLRQHEGAEAARACVHVSEEVPLDEMDNAAEAGAGAGAGRTYPCRCGDRFSLTAQDERARVTILDCPTCSLHIRVLYGSGDG
jgi:curved DNA-binding protein CbpA